MIRDMMGYRKKRYTRLHSPPRGFTLVELLVVISIIALLLSILMPSLQKARAQTKKLTCITNLRQFGLLITMYANDNNGNVSPEWKGPDEYIAYIAGATGLFFELGYIKDTKVYLCPDSPLSKKYNMNTIDNSDGGADNSCRVSYEYYPEPLNLTGCRTSDAAIMWDLWGGWSSDWAQYAPGWNVSWLKSHRNQGGGILYVDGHATFLNRLKWWVNTSGNEPRFTTDFNWPIHRKDAAYGK